MSDPEGQSAQDQPDGPDAARIGIVRLAIGLVQGLALWGLHRAADGVLQWPATTPQLFLPLLLICLFIPILLMAGIGRMRRRTLALWAAVAAAGLAVMGWHEVARQAADAALGPPFISGPMPLFAAAALFIGHHLILPADLERRPIASYGAYFDAAGKAAVQLALSLGFVGAFWVLLFLGAALFRVIGLDFLEDLTRRSWFYVPATTLVLALAVHLTDARDALVRGVRTVGLMLLSWLLLLMTVLAAGFLAALPFTGLGGLWDTGSGTTLVLCAAAALILLINAAYQDGRAENRPPTPLRLAVQAAALLLGPLVVIAVYGLLLRIGQHGLTPERIIAFACTAVGAVFAIGYAWASIASLAGRVDWMRPLEPTTLAGGVAALGLILALFTPVLDPARLAVMDQMARLERGQVAPDRFDYEFLRAGSGRAGRAALARLAAAEEPEVRRRAQAARSRPSHVAPALLPPSADLEFQVRPEGARLPESFLAQSSRFGSVLHDCAGESGCPARLLDLDGDGRPEVLVSGRGFIGAFRQGEDGLWMEWGRYLPVCADHRSDLRDVFRSETVETATPGMPALVVNGLRFSSLEFGACSAKAGEPSPPGPLPE